MFTTGQPVVMYKELHNKYDSNATLVRTNTGTVLGYVPRTHNGRIADNAARNYMKACCAAHFEIQETEGPRYDIQCNRQALSRHDISFKALSTAGLASAARY